MISEIIIPKLGATGGDVTLDEWLVGVGAFVNAGAPILTLTTDKATVELEAFRSGYLRAYLAHTGDTIEIGTAVALLADSMDEALGEYATRVVTDEGRQTEDDRQPITKDARSSSNPIVSGDPVMQSLENQKSKIRNPKSEIRNFARPPPLHVPPHVAHSPL